MKVAVALVFGMILASMMGVESAGTTAKPLSNSDAEKLYEVCIEKAVAALKTVDLAALTKVEASCLSALQKTLSVDTLSSTLLGAIKKVNAAAETAVKAGSSSVKDVVKAIHTAFDGIKSVIAGLLKN